MINNDIIWTVKTLQSVDNAVITEIKKGQIRSNRGHIRSNLGQIRSKIGDRFGAIGDTFGVVFSVWGHIRSEKWPKWDTFGVVPGQIFGKTIEGIGWFFLAHGGFSCPFHELTGRFFGRKTAEKGTNSE